MALIFGTERFHDVERELYRITRTAWEEVGDNRDAMPLDVNWHAFRRLEDSGCLLVVTARDAGRLVGYVIHVVVPSLHSQTHLIAKDDAHYLAPDYRQAWNAFKLFRLAERELRARGVSAISYHQKVRGDLNKGALFERLGYALQENIYTKFL